MGIIATARLMDSYGRVTTKQVETLYSDLATAQTQLGNWATDFAAVTDLELVEITYSLKDNADAFAGASGSNLDVGATFTVLLESGKNAPHKIPGFPASLVGGQGTIDVTQSEVVAYFANYQNPQGCALSDGEQIASVVKGQLDR